MCSRCDIWFTLIDHITRRDKALRNITKVVKTDADAIGYSCRDTWVMHGEEKERMREW